MHYHWPQNFLVQDAANYGKFDSPYRFNANELDQEPSEASSRTPLKNKTKREQTGNYYYGARYYNPQTSIWLSVDPWAEKYPHVTPYNFVENNPIMLVDPDGYGPGGPTGLGSNPLFTIAHGFQQYFRAVGREADKLGGTVKVWLSLNFNIAPSTTATEKVTVEAGLTAEEFFTPTNDKPNAPMPVKFEVKKESTVETKAGTTVQTPYGPVSGEVSQTTDANGKSTKTATASYGGQGQGAYIETSIDNQTGETTTRAGVRVETETPKINGWSIGIGAEASGGG